MVNVELMNILKERFENNMERHKDIDWSDVEIRIEENEEKFYSLYEMEKTGGEPDVIGCHKETGEYIFCDCSKESPKNRRSICYDGKSQEERIKKMSFLKEML